MSLCFASLSLPCAMVSRQTKMLTAKHKDKKWYALFVLCRSGWACCVLFVHSMCVFISVRFVQYYITGREKKEQVNNEQMFPSWKFDKVYDKLWPKCSLVRENLASTQWCISDAPSVFISDPLIWNWDESSAGFSISYHIKYKADNSDLEHSPLSFTVKQSQTKRKAKKEEIMQPKTNPIEQQYQHQHNAICWCIERHEKKIYI